MDHASSLTLPGEAARPPGPRPSEGSAAVDFPVAFGLESHLEQAVLGIVAFTAFRTNQIAAPGGTLTVVIFGYGKSCAAAARDQEHAERARGLAAIDGLGSRRSARAGRSFDGFRTAGSRQDSRGAG